MVREGRKEKNMRRSFAVVIVQLSIVVIALGQPYYYKLIPGEDPNARIDRFDLRTRTWGTFMSDFRLGLEVTQDPGEQWVYLWYRGFVAIISSDTTRWFPTAISNELLGAVFSPLANRFYLTWQGDDDTTSVSAAFDATTFSLIDTLREVEFFFTDGVSSDGLYVYGWRRNDSTDAEEVTKLSTATNTIVRRIPLSAIGPPTDAKGIEMMRRSIALLRYYYPERAMDGLHYQAVDVNSDSVFAPISFPWRSEGYLSPNADYIILERVDLAADGEHRPGNVSIYESRTGRPRASLQLPPEGRILMFNNHPDTLYYYVPATNSVVYVDFGRLPRQFILSVNTVGGGTVTKNPDQPSYDSASTVQLSAVASAGNYFINWSGDVNDTAHTVTITMNSNKSITAHFLDDLGLVTASESSSNDATATNNARHLTKSTSYLHEVLTSGGNVFYRRSSNGGSTWNLTSQITQNGSNSRPCITTKGHDYLQMVWQRNVGSSTFEVWHSYSSDDGSSWSTPAILPSATQVTVSTFQSQGATPVITETVGAQTLVAVYCSSSGLRYRTSTNRGVTWQVPQNDIISGQYNDRVEYPGLAGGSSSISLLYDYAGQDGGPYSRVFNGTSWGSETSVSKGTGATVGAFSSVAIDGNNSPIAAWSGMTNSWTRSIIFRSGSSNNTWSKWFASFGQGQSGPDWVNPALTYFLAQGSKYGVDIVNHTSSNQVKLIQFVDPSWTTSTLSQSGVWGSITEGTSSSGTPTYCWTDQGPFPYEIVTSSSGLSPSKSGTMGTFNTVGVIQKRRAVVYHPVLGSTLTFDFGPIRIVNTNGDTSDIGFRTPSLRDRDSINFVNMWDYLGSEAVNLPANAQKLIVGKQFGIRGPSIWKQRFLFRVLNTNGLPIGVLDTMANDGTVSLNVSRFAGMRIVLRPQVPLGGIDPAAVTVGVGDIFLLSIPPGEPRDKSR